MARKAERQLEGLKQRCNARIDLKSFLESTVKSSLITEIEGNISPAATRLFASQLKCGKKVLRGCRFSTETNISALSLCRKGPKAYKLLQTMLPMPSPRTLISLLESIPFLPGINKLIFEHLRENDSYLDVNDSGETCALLFHEVPINTCLQYSEKLDHILGFEDFGDIGRENVIATHALVFMVRGLDENWKQPVAYFFCRDITKRNRLESLIVKVVESLQNIGLRILCIISDERTNYRAALQNLAASRPSNVELGSHGLIFNINDDDIAVIFDPPSLLKSTRDAFMEYNVVWTPAAEVESQNELQPSGSTHPQKVEATWDHVKFFAKKDDEAIYQMASKLTRAHIEPNAQEKQRVDLAAQLMSRAVATGIHSCVMRNPDLLPLMESPAPPASLDNYLPASAEGSARFVYDVNRLFDSFNGTLVRAVSIKRHRAALTARSVHKTLWPELTKLIDTWEFTDEKTGTIQRPTFQDCWLTSIAGATYVGIVLRKKYRLPILQTRFLNKDTIENLSHVILQYGLHNPSCVQFVSAFKTCIINNWKMVDRRSSICLPDRHFLKSDLKSFLPRPPKVSKLVPAEEAMDKDQAPEYTPFGPEDLSDEIEDENSKLNQDGYDLSKVYVEIQDQMKLDHGGMLPENKTAMVAYVCNFIVVKMADLSCERCKSLLTIKASKGTINQTNEPSLHKNVSMQFTTSMELAVHVINEQLQRAPHALNLRKQIENQITSKVDFEWFDCDSHRLNLLPRMITLLCRVTIHQFCDRNTG